MLSFSLSRMCQRRCHWSVLGLQVKPKSQRKKTTFLDPISNLGSPYGVSRVTNSSILFSTIPAKGLHTGSTH